MQMADGGLVAERSGHSVRFPAEAVALDVWNPAQLQREVLLDTIEGAARLLGRPPEVEGTVVSGDARGGTLGYPTANLRVDPDLLVPAYGIYAGWAEGSDTPGKGFWVTPPSDDMLRQTVVTGTPQEVAHRLRPVVDAFGDRPEFHLIVRLHYPGMDYDTASRAVELFGEKVIPALKGG